jgi:Mn-dependent DtxR family transcriptional regulator
MLGVQRPTISLSMKALAARGAISYRYGKITILDRQALIDAACECYIPVS